MPAYNQQIPYLRESIESILNQTVKDFEFIIVDDGSTDKNMMDVLNEYSKLDSRIRIIQNETNQGIISSLNRALESATGILIARMDSDDIALPDRFEKQLNFLAQHPEYVLVGAWATIIGAQGEEIGGLEFPNSYEIIRSTLLMRNAILHPTWMFRRSLIDDVGYYDERAVSTEDYEFLLRIAKNHPIANLPERLLRYRFNTAGLSFGNNKLQEKNALIIRFRALRDYGYPLWQGIYLLWPFFFYVCIPSSLKKLLIRISFRTL
jgi:glycosyltransferase involved in cell wall biosynthesis